MASEMFFNKQLISTHFHSSVGIVRLPRNPYCQARSGTKAHVEGWQEETADGESETGGAERRRVLLTLGLWQSGDGIQQEAASERQLLAGLV